MLPYKGSLKEFSRSLRRNMTDAENLLWSRVRRKQLKGFQFYRQKIIGKYIVDLYCPMGKLVIELDGGQHYVDKGRQRDELRDCNMAGRGLKVLRFSDREIFENLDGVMEKIWENL
jgi:very-short-patch-repair endonuclease